VKLKPGVAVRVGDGLGEFMGESAVVESMSWPLGCPGEHCTRDVLEWLNSVEDVADVREGDTVVIGAEDKGVRLSAN